MKFKVVSIVIFMIILLIGCNSQQPETMWYRDKLNFHEINNQRKIEEIKEIVTKMQWKGNEQNHVDGDPDFAFWIGRNKDNIRIIQCDVWKLVSGNFGITISGEGIDILNRYSEITQDQFNRIVEILGANRNNI